MGEDPAGYDPNAGGYGPDDYDPDPHVATYQAGQTAGPPAGPRLHWKQLLTGVVLRPQQTYLQMRDYQVWAPALTVTFIYGLFLTLFGFTKEGEENVFLSSSLSASIPGLLFGAVSVMIGMLMLGAVSNALARQLGGDGIWAPTIGLAMLITTLTDIPRLLFAAFLHTDNNLVQVIGWFTLALGGALLTLMVSKSHDLPWPRALGACSIQLVALFVLHTLPAAGG